MRRAAAVLALGAAVLLSAVPTCPTAAAFSDQELASVTVPAGRLQPVLPVSCAFEAGGQQVSWSRKALGAGDVVPSGFTVSVAAGIVFDSADDGTFTGFTGGGYSYTYSSVTGVYRLYNSTPDWNGSVDFWITAVVGSWQSLPVKGNVNGTTNICTWPAP